MSKIIRPLGWLLGLVILVVVFGSGLLAAAEQVELNRYSMSNRCATLLDQYDQCMLDNGYVADDRRYPDYTRRFLGNFAHRVHVATDGGLGLDDQRYRQGPLGKAPRKGAAAALPAGEASRAGVPMAMPGAKQG